MDEFKKTCQLSFLIDTALEIEKASTLRLFSSDKLLHIRILHHYSILLKKELLSYNEGVRADRYSIDIGVTETSSFVTEEYEDLDPSKISQEAINMINELSKKDKPLCYITRSLEDLLFSEKAKKKELKYAKSLDLCRSLFKELVSSLQSEISLLTDLAKYYQTNSKFYEDRRDVLNNFLDDILSINEDVCVASAVMRLVKSTEILRSNDLFENIKNIVLVLEPLKSQKYEKTVNKMRSHNPTKGDFIKYINNFTAFFNEDWHERSYLVINLMIDEITNLFVKLNAFASSYLLDEQQEKAVGTLGTMLLSNLYNDKQELSQIRLTQIVKKLNEISSKPIEEEVVINPPTFGVSGVDELAKYAFQKKFPTLLQSKRELIDVDLTSIEEALKIFSVNLSYVPGNDIKFDPVFAIIRAYLEKNSDYTNDGMLAEVYHKVENKIEAWLVDFAKNQKAGEDLKAKIESPRVMEISTGEVKSFLAGIAIPIAFSGTVLNVHVMKNQLPNDYFPPQFLKSPDESILKDRYAAFVTSSIFYKLAKKHIKVNETPVLGNGVSISENTLVYTNSRSKRNNINRKSPLNVVKNFETKQNNIIVSSNKVSQQKSVSSTEKNRQPESITSSVKNEKTLEMSDIFAVTEPEVTW